MWLSPLEGKVDVEARESAIDLEQSRPLLGSKKEAPKGWSDDIRCLP